MAKRDSGKGVALERGFIFVLSGGFVFSRESFHPSPPRSCDLHAVREPCAVPSLARVKGGRLEVQNEWLVVGGLATVRLDCGRKRYESPTARG